MIRRILMATVLMVSMAAFADVEVDTRGLSESQKADLVKQAEAMKAQAADEVRRQAEAAIEKAPVDKVEDWVNVGEKIGKMLGGAAKEVGIAVNQFVMTPVGKMTAAVIIWNYMGNAIVHVIAGWVLLIGLNGATIWYTRRLSRVVIDYDMEKEPNRFGKYPVKKYSRDPLCSEVAFCVGFAHIIATLVSIAVMFTGW